MKALPKCSWLIAALIAAVGLICSPSVVFAQGGTTPPDLTVCEGVNCDNLPNSVCSDAGFKITLTNFTKANGGSSGSATYTYQICSPPAGVCQGGTGLRAGESCLENSFCQRKGMQTDPDATCSRECAVDNFFGLSHFDVVFPELGGLNSCLSSTTSVTGTCTVIDNPPSGGSSTGNFVLGDGSCFDGGTSQSIVAKCDNTNIQPGDCVQMTLNIAGELNGLGLGAAVVVDKESTTCTASCIEGPSCTPCEEPPNGGACLTRTIGFWGTHPWITNDYDPVTVCGATLGCNGASDGKSNPSCEVGTCTSIMEGLGSIPSELGSNQSYVAMIRQLTAAKLNLNATSALFSGATCSGFKFQDKTIQQWITTCEALCGADKATISNSGCIEALDAFNNSQDTGFTQTPAPFDRPPVDDFGNVSGADPKGFTGAQKNKVVIGKNIPGGGQCAIP
jgi:hypothetical protein